MIRASLLALCLAGPALAEAPDPMALLGRFDAIYDESGGMGVEHALVQALEEARAEGPLAPEWARVMAVAATQLLAGLARYERGFALLEEAEGVAGEDARSRRMVLALRAYFEAWFGRNAAARKTLARFDGRLEDYLDPEQIAVIEAAGDAPDDVAGSAGFTRLTGLAAEAGTLITQGDFDQARQILRGLFLPDALSVGAPLVALMNSTNALTLATVATLRGETAEARAMLEAATAALTGPEGAVRADVLTMGMEGQVLIQLLTIHRAYLTQGLTPPPALLEAAEPLAGASPEAAAEWHLKLARDASAIGDWAGSAEEIEAALASGGMDDEARASWAARVVAQRAFAAIQAGEPADHSALSQAFGTLMGASDVSAILKIGPASELVDAMWLDGEVMLTSVAGSELFRFMAEVQGATLQSGETAAAMAGYWRDVADRTIAAGFRLTIDPQDGTPPPAQVCQEFLEIAMCTVQLD